MLLNNYTNTQYAIGFRSWYSVNCFSKRVALLDNITNLFSSLMAEEVTRKCVRNCQIITFLCKIIWFENRISLKCVK